MNDSVESGAGVLERLRALLAAEGEALTPALAPADQTPVVGPRALAGANGRAQAAELALVLESILEGYLLHYGRPRLVQTADEDLRLLAGDHLYAVGLSRLSRLGDLDAVRALADLITLCANAHARASADGTVGERTGALWLLTTLAVSGGRWPGFGSAIEAARDGRASDEELLSEAQRRAAELGLGLEAQAALIAFGAAVTDRPHA
jgi:hypothetical protein